MLKQSMAREAKTYNGGKTVSLISGFWENWMATC